MSSVAEHSLPSLLKALFSWYDVQIPEIPGHKARTKSQKDDLSERRDVSGPILGIYTHVLRLTLDAVMKNQSLSLLLLVSSVIL